MEIIIAEEVMDKLDMSQSRFGKIYEFGWWDLERISADSGRQFTSMEFLGKFQTCGVHLMLEAPEHQDMTGTFEVTGEH